MGERRNRIVGLVVVVVLVVMLVGVQYWQDHRHRGPSQREVNTFLTCVTGPDPKDC
jgi:predicted negative regulator of RcsB-dependent stress response